jgi:hypothetical protein
MRKTFLLGGITLLLATVSLAGQRTRGGDSIRSDSRAEAVARTEGREIAPGVVVAKVNGVVTTVRENNAVVLEEVLGDFPSVEAYITAQALAGVRSMPSGNSKILANGAHVLLEGYVEPEYLPWTVEQHKTQVASMEVEVNGQTATLFVDGVVGIDSDQRGPQITRFGCMDMGSKMACIDGSVGFED